MPCAESNFLSVKESIKLLLVLCATVNVFAGISHPPVATAKEVTFIFLADPQVNRHESANGKNKDNVQLVSLQRLNYRLNKIDEGYWPSNNDIWWADQDSVVHSSGSLTCENEPIDEVSSIFFGGDLTQVGGDRDGRDQEQRFPYFYKGGFELQVIRLLFDKEFDELDVGRGPNRIQWDADDFVKTDYKRVYFGLGNHDIGSDYYPEIRWRKGGGQLAYYKWDYWRWQMWNFISQMHAGPYVDSEEGYLNPTFPVDAIDAPPAHHPYTIDCFDWHKYSFNYRVDLGPVEVFQLHYYGGYNGSAGDTINPDDRPWDKEIVSRASGIHWLNSELEKVGRYKPIIIVQHLPFKSNWWADERKDALAAILEPYNIIGLLTGHIHSRPFHNQEAYHFPRFYSIPDSLKAIKDFTPGNAAGIVDDNDTSGDPMDDLSNGGNFFLLRVTDTDFNIAHGQVNLRNPDLEITWRTGYGEEFFIANAGGPYVGDEGSEITFDASLSKGSIDAYKWDLDNDGDFETPGQVVSMKWYDDYSGPVALEILDSESNSTTDSTTVTVNNVPPTVMDVSVIPPVPGFILPGQELAFEGSFTDPGAMDTHNVEWDFGDGNKDPGNLTVGNEPHVASGTVSVTHAYAEPGTYTISLKVEDDDNGVGTYQVEVEVMTASEAVDYIDDIIQDLPGSAFKKKAAQLKNAFSEKLVAIQEKIAAGDLHSAIKKLQNDIRAKADGSVDGKSKNDWITNEDSQMELCLLIDELVKYFESQ